LKIFRYLRRSANRKLIDRLHGEIVAAARNRDLFTGFGIADTFEGRFEAVTLHAVLVLRRLNALPPPAPEIAQDLADTVFRHFDLALRDLGVSDTSVPKKMKVLAEAFFGRAGAYDRALRNSGAELGESLLRNVYAGRGDPGRLARYVMAADAALARAELGVFTKGNIPFPEPSEIN
jgi:cytochrome b pre-mRNA-processing protein 3